MILKIKMRSPKQGDLENQDQDRDLKIKITSKITYYTAYEILIGLQVNNN